MLIHDFCNIGGKLADIRRHYGMTQADVAAAAEISERAYAEIERGNSNMRLGTMVRICEVLHITPNDILYEEDETYPDKAAELLDKLDLCTPKDKQTALAILSIYLSSLDKQ